jgi:precorrin-6Y C5,15-methyltransferase (decarboxylating)
MVREKIVVLGMGLSARDLTAAHLEMIRTADLLVGGRRHLGFFEDLPVEKRTITGDVEDIMTLLRAQPPHRRVVVLASGDPLLFGIGGRLVRELGHENVEIVPNVSSMAAAFARLGESWEAAALVSLHGREDTSPLAAALGSRALTAVLTDGRRDPAWLAHWLMDKGAEHVRLAVFEKLGTSQERWAWYTTAQAAAMVFDAPNLVVIKACGPAPTLRLGLDDEAYAHEEGLITKAEVRAVALAKLALGPGMTVWDLGAGSGAVGIEAALFIGPGRIVAVEAKPRRAAQIRENARRLGVYNLEVFEARLPDGLAALPPPDRVFVGGGGRDLPAIIARAAEHLTPAGVMVVNTVLLDNLAPAVDGFQRAGMAVEVVQIQIGRSKPMPWSLRLAAENPVWVIRGSRK